jgi:hypothetical protein
MGSPAHGRAMQGAGEQEPARCWALPLDGGEARGSPLVVELAGADRGIASWRGSALIAGRELIARGSDALIARGSDALIAGIGTWAALIAAIGTWAALIAAIGTWAELIAETGLIAGL